ncbi:MAG: hypothetical protein HY864_08445 [Chloroflexi bacterium]|nr:hypothetical protein [Chloroflexota bacterium]
MNFTFQDIFGAVFAFCIFPLVLVFPGYVVGWGLDLFGFRHRRPLVRLGLGVLLSFAASPALLYLTWYLLPFNFVTLTLGGFALAFAVIIIKQKFVLTSDTKAFLWFGAAWSVLAILSLINIQWGGRLFLSVTSFDQTTRVSIIDAITRTGVPPVNPGYYPGHPVQLTFLYYFWYILCSVVDIIGGRFVDARAALNASSAWAGIGLMAAVALYLRQRNAARGESAFRSARRGIFLLAVSGLDVMPIIILMLATGQIVGSIDVWNTWIPSWVASNLWAPHHVAALAAGLAAIMLAQFARGRPLSRQFQIMAVAGLALASALGFSIYVTFVFVLFWCAWISVLYFQKTERGRIFPMVFAGFTAVLLSTPFLMGLFQGGGTGQFPLTFEVRTLLQLESIVKDWPPLARSLMMVAALPINYLLELGFFFVAGVYWLQNKNWKVIHANSFYLAEVILLAVVLLVGSTLRSTVITSNDLGWRAWLPGQFVLLIWGADVMENLFSSTSAQVREELKTKKILTAFLVIGLLTSTADAILLRAAWPLMTGAEETRRYYSARLAYDTLREDVLADVITQNNPLNYVDRPSGMFGAHQMVISDRTAYGISSTDFDNLSDRVAVLFANDNPSWNSLDESCRELSIGVLILENSDPLWSGLSALEAQRVPLYKNERYALFTCGNYLK